MTVATPLSSVAKYRGSEPAVPSFLIRGRRTWPSIVYTVDRSANTWYHRIYMVNNGLICRSATNTLKPHNEDAHGWEANTFWVIDGSTPVTPDGHADVFRFVELLNEAIKEELRSGTDQPLVSHIQRAHRTVLRHWSQAEAGSIPTASIIAAKVAQQWIQFYALGDCTAYVEVGKHTTEVMDPKFRGRESQLLNQVQIDMERGTPAEAVYSGVEVPPKQALPS